MKDQLSAFWQDGNFTEQRRTLVTLLLFSAGLAGLHRTWGAIYYWVVA